MGRALQYPPHNRLTVLGDFFHQDVLEEWQFSLNMRGLGQGDAGEEDNTKIATALSTWWSNVNIGPAMSSKVRLYGFKWNAILPTGKYKFPERGNTYLFNPIKVGGSATGKVFPLQTALAVTLRTGLRGKSYNGRVYIPLQFTDVQLTAGYRLGSSYCDGVAIAFANLIGDLNSGIGVDKGCSVHVCSTKGFSTKVTDVQVGDVPDTIRSRRRSLAEEYGSPQPV